MAGNYCPIYDRQDGRLLSIGLWTLDPRALDHAIAEYRSSGSVDVGMQVDLLGLAEPTLRFLTEAKTRRIANEAVDVGNGVRFEGGLFMMLEPYLAPNEELPKSAAGVSYVLQMQDGIRMLKRSGPRPQAATSPAPITESPTTRKRWWQFWRSSKSKAPEKSDDSKNKVVALLKAEDWSALKALDDGHVPVLLEIALAFDPSHPEEKGSNESYFLAQRAVATIGYIDGCTRDVAQVLFDHYVAGRSPADADSQNIGGLYGDVVRILQEGGHIRLAGNR